MTDMRKARIREYSTDFSEAYRKEQTREYVIAYMDESCVHTSHRSNFSNYPDIENRSANTSRIGKRIIVVQAKAKDGPFVADEHKDRETGFPKPE